MGNICGCCNGEPETQEYTPVPTNNYDQPAPRARARSVEKSNPNTFQTILEGASNSLLFIKSKYKEIAEPSSVESLRNRIQTAKVDPNSIEASPILIRSNHITSESKETSSSQQEVVKLLSNPISGTGRSKDFTKVIRSSEENYYQSYQKENLPLVSFNNNNTPTEK